MARNARRNLQRLRAQQAARRSARDILRARAARGVALTAVHLVAAAAIVTWDMLRYTI